MKHLQQEEDLLDSHTLVLQGLGEKANELLLKINEEKAKVEEEKK